MSRRGAGLVELIIALTLSTMVAFLAWSILAASAARLRDRSERIGLTHALRVSAGALRAMVEPMGWDSAGDADLAAPTPSGLTSRVIRAAGTVCQVALDAVVVHGGEPWWLAVRVPVAGRDSLLVGTQDAAPRWVMTALQAAPSNTLCPDGSPGLRLPFPIGGLAGVAVGSGSPLRVVEPVEFRQYSSNGSGWTGATLLATGQAIQPLAGPIAGLGLALSYFRRDGVIAGNPAEVVVVGAVLRGLTERAQGVGVARLGSVRADSAGFSILLRNVP